MLVYLMMLFHKEKQLYKTMRLKTALPCLILLLKMKNRFLK